MIRHPLTVPFLICLFFLSSGAGGASRVAAGLVGHALALRADGVVRAERPPPRRLPGVRCVLEMCLKRSRHIFAFSTLQSPFHFHIHIHIRLTHNSPFLYFSSPTDGTLRYFVRHLTSESLQLQGVAMRAVSRILVLIKTKAPRVAVTILPPAYQPVPVAAVTDAAAAASATAALAQESVRHPGIRPDNLVREKEKKRENDAERS